jgi:hypothetical protein
VKTFVSIVLARRGGPDSSRTRARAQIVVVDGAPRRDGHRLAEPAGRAPPAESQEAPPAPGKEQSEGKSTPRLEKLKKLEYDRRPSAILAAWSTRRSAEREENREARRRSRARDERRSRTRRGRKKEGRRGAVPLPCRLRRPKVRESRRPVIPRPAKKAAAEAEKRRRRKKRRPRRPPRRRRSKPRRRRSSATSRSATGTR